MTHGYAFTPNTNVQVTAVRGYNSDKVSIWTDSGTLLASQTVSASGELGRGAAGDADHSFRRHDLSCQRSYPGRHDGYFLTASWPTTFANGTVGQNFY